MKHYDKRLFRSRGISTLNAVFLAGSLAGLCISGVLSWHAHDGVKDILQSVSFLCFIILFVTLFSIWSDYRLQKNNNRSNFIRELVESGEYFSRKIWQRKYRDYCAKHPVKQLNASSLRKDLCFRYLKRKLKNLYLWLIILPIAFAFPVNAIFMSCTGGGILGLGFWENFMLTAFTVIMAVMSVLIFLSLRPFGRWLDAHPQYADRKDDIIKSYLNGYMFECFCFIVVISRHYVHAFDGVNFYTIPRDGVVRVKTILKRYMVYSRGRNGETYTGDEYQFEIRFISDRAGQISIPLDQFQIRMITDKFFPDIPDVDRCTMVTEKSYSYSLVSLKSCTSKLVIYD